MKIHWLIFLFIISLESVKADSVTKRFLLSELQSRNNAMTAEKIAALKDYVGESEVRNTLISILNNANYAPENRIEAAHALSEEAVNSRTYQALMSQFRNEQNVLVKSEILKSLYLAAGSNSTVLNFVQDALRREKEELVQVAAIFALKEAAGRSQVHDSLVQIATDDTLSNALRIEALKSLFLARNQYRVEKAIEFLSLKENDEVEIQVAALKLYKGLQRSNIYRDQLIRLIQTTKNADVLKHAVKALETKFDEQEVQWINPRVFPNVGAVIVRDCLN